MSSVTRFEIVLLLIAMIVVLEMLAQRLQRPRAAALIVGGIGLAMIPGTPNIELDPDLVMVLFLPPLLMASAWFTAWRDFRADIRIIMQLAVGAVVFLRRWSSEWWRTWCNRPSHGEPASLSAR